jgi:DNA-binding CsgD family transcriptional regulator
MMVHQPALFSGAIDLLYAAVADPLQWQPAVDRLRMLFNASTACLVRSGPDLQPHDAVNANPNLEFQLRYIEDHAPHPNLYADVIEAAPVGLIYSDRALVGDAALRRSRFWNEWMAPQDMYGGLGAKLMAVGPSCWFFDVQRGRNQEPFDAAERDLLQLLSPHLRRATELSRKFRLAQAQSASYANLPFGIIIVDANLRVVHLSDVADRILSQAGTALRLRAGMLATSNSRSTALLQALVADACELGIDARSGMGGDFLLRADGVSSKTDLIVTVSPARGGDTIGFPQPRHAIVHLRMLTLALPDGFEDHVRQLFDFTPAEARLAAALASGIALKEAAAHQGIRFSTARSYLEHIFRKTGTRQQSQLVALLKSTQPLHRLS